MGTNNVDWLRFLMDPVNLDICLLCGDGKGKGYLTCAGCRGRCPDRHCKVKGTKSWDYDQCSDCYRFLRYCLPEGRDWYVYLCDDGYIGMTSDPDARDAGHDYAGRAIIWCSPPELGLDKYQAFKFEWALDAMGEWGVRGKKYLANRFEMITCHYPSPDSLVDLRKRPPLFSD